MEPRSNSPASSRTLLRREIEVPEILDLVAPELGADWFRHAERVHVENAAANAELRDIFDHRDALEADSLEVFGELGEPVRCALA